jgi:hypothetical protein
MSLKMSCFKSYVISAVFLVASLAHAHGEPPRALGVLESPGRSNETLVSTNFGALLSQDDGASFHWVCDEAIGYKPNERPRWAMGPDGALWAATFSGLFKSVDQGCTWSTEPRFAMTGASDIVMANGTYWVTTSQFGVLNGLFRSDDGGKTFDGTVLESAKRFFSAVKVAPSMPSRMYVSAWYFEPLEDFLFISDDGGKTFSRAALGQLPALGPLKVEAIDPSNADIVYLSLASDAPPLKNWLLKSTDGGQTVATLLELASPVQSFSISADGKTLRVSDGIRVWTQVDGAKPFEPEVKPSKDGCVSQGQNGDYVCGSPVEDGFAVAKLASTGPAPFLNWNKIVSKNRCADGTKVRQVCDAIWPVLAVSLGLSAKVDEPPPVSPGETPPTAMKKGCSAGIGVLSGLPVAMAILLVNGRKRRKTRENLFSSRNEI